MSPFPQEFMWGAATAAHQVEGDNLHSDWWEWEKIPGKVKNNERSGRACDHWGRLEEDLGYLKEMGLNAYRFTLEWAKLEPREGEIDEKALAHYRRKIALLESLGIAPVITLHHFTSPAWWRAKNGWESKDSPRALGGYAKFCATEIAPKCRRWVTVNEPMVHLGGGYVMGLTPPEKKGFEFLEAPLLGMLRSHAEAYRALHAAIPEAQVGMAHHFRLFDPRRAWHPIDRVVASSLSEAFNWTIPNALETGRVRMKIPGLLNIRAEIPELARTQDFLGVNYYTRDFVHLGKKNGRWEPIPTTKPGAKTNDLGWELYPKGFTRVLESCARRLPSRPMIVTENGIADRDDRHRAEFIRTHLEELRKAVENGIPVQGYFHWSLMDNFEWIEGFEPRFGLYAVDYEQNLERRARPSSRVFAEIVRKSKTSSPSVGEQDPPGSVR